MSAAEIVTELPKLSRRERRTVLAALFDLEDESALLAEIDQRADASFQVLDKMEADDAAIQRR